MIKTVLLFVGFLFLSFDISAQETHTVSSYAFNNEEATTLNDTVKNKKGEVLQEVIIATNQQKDPITVGKAGIKPMDLPQATSVIEGETIKQQQILRLSDAVKNTNGVYVSGANNASGNNQEEIGSRGFSFSGGNTFKNGVRFNSALIPETSSAESIEIIKGSAALLYGNVAPGGILNLVTKKPKFEQGGELNLRVSEYDFFKPTLDVYGSVNDSKTFAYRMITSYEKGNSFREVVSSERIYFSPSFLINLNKKTTLLIEGDYLKDERTPDFGLTTIDYKVIELPRNSFLGFNWGKFKSEQESFTSTLTHQIKENWQFKSLYSYQGYTTDLLSSLRSNSTNLVQANGDWTRGVQKNDAKQDYSLAEIDLNGTFKTGKFKHTLLIGSDADKSTTDTRAFKNITYYDKINIYNPSAIIDKNPDYKSAIVPEMAINTDSETVIRRFGIYAQDLVEISEKFKVLAGLRYSYLDNTTNTLTVSTNTNVESKTKDNVYSTRLGLVYQPTKSSSFFVSYSDSFALNTGTDKNLNALPSSKINQYEVGVKNDLLKNRLTINVTGYVIDFTNLAQTDFSNGNTNTSIKELAGAYQSKGIELDITGNYKGFSMMAGYSFNETKYTKSNIYNNGTALRFTPKNTANSSLFYTFGQENKLRGLELGMMSSYYGKTLGGRLRPNNASTAAELARKPIPVDGYLQFDASIGYSIKNFAIRTKLTNLGNVLSYYVYDDNTVTPIAPRMITTTLSYTF